MNTIVDYTFVAEEKILLADKNYKDKSKVTVKGQYTNIDETVEAFEGFLRSRGFEGKLEINYDD